MSWIEQWLIDMRQRVGVDGYVPNVKSILSGVPQGCTFIPVSIFLLSIIQ